MPSPKIRLDHRGIRAMLRSDPVADAVTELAEQVASNVPDLPVESPAAKGGHDGRLPVDVEQATTDRTVARVVIRHPAGLGMQAKHGVLTRAATAAGLEVRQ